MRCKKKKGDGKQCQARALNGKEHCALHDDPNRAAELGRKGGRNRAVGTPLDCANTLPTEPPKTAEQLRDFLAEVVAHVRQGRLDTKIATAVAYAGATLLRAIEASSLEARLAALEATLPQNLENRDKEST